MGLPDSERRMQPRQTRADAVDQFVAREANRYRAASGVGPDAADSDVGPWPPAGSGRRCSGGISPSYY